MIERIVPAVILTALVAGAAHAAPDPDVVRFTQTGLLAPGFESVAKATFTIAPAAARFRLAGHAFRRPVDGTCERSVDGGGVADMACTFASPGQARPTRLAFRRAVGDPGGTGTLRVNDRDVAFVRRGAEGGPATWSFAVDGEDVAILSDDPGGLKVADHVGRGTREAVTAAAFILRTLAD